MSRNTCSRPLVVLIVATSTSCGAGREPPAPTGHTVNRSPSKSSPAGGELLKRSTFGGSRSAPWMPFFDPPASGAGAARDGAYCMTIETLGRNQWDVQFRHREMTIERDHSYAVRFTAWANRPVGIRAKIGMSGAPYTDYWASDFDLDRVPLEITETFTSFAPDDPTAEFAFHLNDKQVRLPVEICFTELHLTDPQFRPEAVAAQARPPAIRVNQLGYWAKRSKRATWVIEGKDAEIRSHEAVPFELVDSTDAVVFRGNTEPFGRDATSGAYVQRIDFSSVTTTGKNLRLRIAGKGTSEEAAVSDAFSIDEQPLRALSRDAVRFFYFMRSGIALTQPYVEDSVWERVAGHPTDTKAACAPDAGCSYHLNVSGGWYDAGDYGKYVVNGGLSAWLLMNLWEGTESLQIAALGSKDGDLNVPESGNGVPDLLDEARWEMQWLLRMQVPEGEPNAGLVHHKLHDEAWSALGTPPVLIEKVQRRLRPVSTAATLNLAATAAQASRVFARFDPPFAQHCLSAAERAWAAAERTSPLLVTAADNQGGGAYEDSKIDDERFWAASELYLATGKKDYREVVGRSPYYGQTRADGAEKGLPQAFDWRTTDALGTISLALGGRHGSKDDQRRSRASLVAVAERYLALSRSDAFGQPYVGTHYTWGSNSFLLNNGIVLAYAHAFTGEARFLDGAVAVLDYLLGRNALGKCYVSGYGSRPLMRPHHRMWARAANPKFPPPPPGAVAGGPNSDLQDPYSKAANLGCIGQTCYVDHVDAYSANEVAINWNAELAWLVGYLNAVTDAR